MGLNLGLENLGVRKSKRSEGEITVDLLTAEIEANEAGHIVDFKLREGQEISDVLSNLESVQAAIEKDGLTDGVLAIANADGQLEQLIGSKPEEASVEIALDKIKDTAKKSWDAIVEFLKKILASLKDFISKVLDLQNKQVEMMKKQQKRLKSGEIDWEKSKDNKVNVIPKDIWSHPGTDYEKTMKQLYEVVQEIIDGDGSFRLNPKDWKETLEQLDEAFKAVEDHKKEQTLEESGLEPDDIQETLEYSIDFTEKVLSLRDGLEDWLEKQEEIVEDLEKQAKEAESDDEQSSKLEEAQKTQAGISRAVEYLHKILKYQSLGNKQIIALAKALKTKKAD